jgi:hypothetical protein
MKNQIEVKRGAQVPMDNDGNSLHHQVTDLGSLKGGKNPLDSAAHPGFYPGLSAIL